MITLKSILPAGLVYDHIVATGGIGSGIFFSLKNNDTLGRNESRMATLLPYKDFCKQHIIMHYIAVLLGAQVNSDFQSFPIGKIGNDEIGKSLLNQMKAAGIDIKNVSVSDHLNTLFSVCYQYPDHSGGNITTSESASSHVSPEDVSLFFKDFKLNGSKEIILAAPEVPVKTRIKLLEYGRLRGSLNVASILSSEIKEFKNLEGFAMVDILAVNLDEARSIAQTDKSVSTKKMIEACIKNLTEIQPSITVLITCGSAGVYCYKKNHLEFTPALKVPVISTAGAGDAFLAGFVAGICCGLPCMKGAKDDYFSASPLTSATELGILLASLSVTSQDTINTEANAELLYNFIIRYNLHPGTGFSKMFSGCNQNNYSNILTEV
ncbi:MAG: carbohydrate kinase family protein [Chitinophagaceae bacterium]|nr:carbohydrate kinase family protein [Chitinophagaceae bacterium]